MQAPSANPLTEFAEDLENLPKNVSSALSYHQSPTLEDFLSPTKCS